jgi:hypothetical protein
MALRLPLIDDEPEPGTDPDEGSMVAGRADVLGAIELVRRGWATTVTVANLGDAEALSGFALAAASAAGVRFRLDRRVSGPPALRFSREDA